MKDSSRETRIRNKKQTSPNNVKQRVISTVVACLLTIRGYLAPEGVAAATWDAGPDDILINGTFLYDSGTHCIPHCLLAGDHSTNQTSEIALSTIRLNVEGSNRSVVYHLDVRQRLGLTSVLTEGFKLKSLFLSSAAAETFMSTTTLLSMAGPLPVVSILPFHHWHVDGTRFSNGFIPRFGQELKGRALADILLQFKVQLNIRKVLIVRGEQASPELKKFNFEQTKLQTAFTIETISLDSKYFHFEHKLNESVHDADVVVVDCRLHYFELFSSMLVKSNALSQHAWIVFMHDFAEIQNSTSILEIVTILQQFNIQLFAFCQTVEEHLGSCSNFSSPASIYYHLFDDVLTVVGNAIISSEFDGSKVFYQDLHLPNQNMTLPVLIDGAAFVKDLGKQCMSTSYGKLALTTGTATPDDCRGATHVQFQLLSLQKKYHWSIAGRWSASRTAELTTEIDNFTHDFEQENSLDFTKKLRVLYGPDYPPFTYFNSTHNYSGVDFDLLYLIVNELGIHKNKIEFTEWNIKKYSYSDMIATVGSEESTYDMAVGGITATPNRAQTSNFTRSYLVPGISVLAKRPVMNEVNYLWRFLEPFNWTVWITILLTIVFTAAASRWFEIVQDYSSGLWLSCIILFSMNENRLVTIKNPFGRIFLLALSVLVLILVSSYTANMATFLTSSQVQSTIKGLSSLQRQKVAVDVLTQSYILLKEQTGLRNLVSITGNEYLDKFAADEIVAYVSDTPDLVASASKQPNCDLYVLEEEYFLYPFAFAISDKLFVSHGRAIDEIIANAVASQLVATWFSKHLKYGSTCDNVIGLVNDKVPRSGEIDFENLGGVFIIILVAAALCLLARRVKCLKQQMRLSRVAANTENPKILTVEN